MQVYCHWAVTTFIAYPEAARRVMEYTGAQRGLSCSNYALRPQMRPATGGAGAQLDCYARRRGAVAPNTEKNLKAS